ncbi:zinc knuckle CX2CX4HX4C containing protein [Tanacetum coccineum]|uniref:Zinc knuckle CX2CX4HX4C containing protein n=1 Tax=Tanacetum coccineum TaxID=301880 RepID=A0ABQ5C041_9ASTR
MEFARVGFSVVRFEHGHDKSVCEGGSLWRIKLVPIILKVWMPNTILKRKNVSIVPLWVKMHNVPIVAYSKVDLDLIQTKKRLPSLYSIDVVIPLDDGVGHVMVNIGIEYEWQPPRCGTCKNLEHLEAMCPMKLMECPKNKCVNEAELSKGNGQCALSRE